MLQISNLTKRYGDRTLFESVTFAMSPGERLGLVGRNGCGKSTLFRIILGTESPETGNVVIPRGYKIGHLAQHLQFSEQSALKEACLGLHPDQRDEEYRGEIILAGLGFSEDDVHKDPASFSGGFQIRINLAKLLLSEPNLLLLDEPTNYLDIVSMRWLAGFLQDWQNEMILISHDRLFMDSVTTHSMLIHRGNIRKMSGPTDKLYQQIEVDEEIYEKTRLNEEKKREKLEVFINKNRAKASKATLVQSKIKALERMGKKEELTEEESLAFQFQAAPFPGKIVADINDVSFGYNESQLLIDNLSFTIRKNDRIGVIGKNGKGKSTLLRLLAGELKPLQGSVQLNQNARLGYFGQTNISRLSPGLTVEQEVTDANPTLHRTRVRTICGIMMFEGDDALKKISVLSGGEKSRVLLGKILAQPSNILLLDEPTNHLDMESIEALIESLKTYEGAVVLVTHSELLLQELATRLVVFSEEAPRVLEHDYAYFLENEGWGDDDGMSGQRQKKGKSRKEGRREGAKQLQEKSKVIGPIEHEIRTVEDTISRLEEENKEIGANLAAASEKADVKRITTESLRLKENGQQIELLFEKLSQLETTLQEQKRRFGAA